MQIEDAKKLAEKHFESANSRSAAAAKTGLAFLAALILLWISNIEPVVPVLHQATERAQSVKSLGKYLQSTRDEKQKFEAQRTLSVDSLKKETGALASKLKKTVVDFKVPGFDSFKVSVKYAALVFNILFLGVIYYMLTARSEVRTLVARGIRLANHENNGSTLLRPNVILFMPWWIAPLPSLAGQKVQKIHILDLIEWHTRHRFYVLVLLVFLLALCAVQVRVCMISLLSAHAFAQIETAWAVYSVSAASVFITMITLACACVWLFPGRVPDELFGESPPSAKRRDTLKAIVTTVGFAAVVTALTLRYPLAFVRPMRTPRYVFRKRPKPSTINLATGFYVNKRSDMIHYISRNHSSAILAPMGIESELVGVRTSLLRKPKPKNFELLHDTGFEYSRLNKSAATTIIERAASDAHQAGKIEEACSILLSAIQSDLKLAASSRKRFPASQLYYMLARYAILSDKTAWLDKMIDAINQNGKLAVFTKPIASWTDPNGRWRKRLRYVK